MKVTIIDRFSKLRENLGKKTHVLKVDKID